MIIRRDRNRQGADRTEVLLHPLVPLTIELLVLELCRTLLTGLLVLLAMCLLTLHAAVFDEATGRAVLELDGVAPGLAAVCASFFSFAITVTRHAVHCDIATRGPGPATHTDRPRPRPRKRT